MRQHCSHLLTYFQAKILTNPHTEPVLVLKLGPETNFCKAQTGTLSVWAPFAQLPLRHLCHLRWRLVWVATCLPDWPHWCLSLSSSGTLEPVPATLCRVPCSRKTCGGKNSLEQYSRLNSISKAAAASDWCWRLVETRLRLQVMMIIMSKCRGMAMMVMVMYLHKVIKKRVQPATNTN